MISIGNMAIIIQKINFPVGNYADGEIVYNCIDILFRKEIVGDIKLSLLFVII